MTLENSAATEARLELKPFLFHAVLWLPIAFFAWFVLRGYIIEPVIAMVAWLFGNVFPGIITDLAQDVHNLRWKAIAELGNVIGLPPGARLELTEGVTVNVLKFCYGIPVLIALSIATPITWKRTGVQILVGVPILLVIMAFGVAGEILKQLMFDFGGIVNSGLINEGYPNVAGAAAANAQAAMTAQLASHGLTPTLVAAWYQFGYLILPPISAVVLWILLNRRFIERLNPAAGRR
jgi:hypothetical protein